MDKIFIVKGDIVKSKVDAIVNAANTSLLGGGRVDACIHRSAGPELLAECEKLNGCKTGEAKITQGYKLLAKYVIHTPGPIWRGGERQESELLESCYKNCLKLAVENNIATIAFPSISTGVYRYPTKDAAKIAIKALTEFLKDDDSIKKVFIVCYDDATFKHYKNSFKNLTKKEQQKKLKEDAKQQELEKLEQDTSEQKLAQELSNS